jgi:Methyltransferase domain
VSIVRGLLGDGLTDVVKRATGVSRYQLRQEEDRRREQGQRFNQQRVDFLARYLPANGVGAELGVFKGQFSPFLLEALRPQTLHLIDPWYLLAPEWPWADGNKSTVDALVDILRSRREDINAGRVVVHVSPDCELLETMPDGHFDWVYVDSSHAYEHTVKELDLLRRKMKHRGLIAGDDWCPETDHKHHGVFKAVTELVEAGEFEILAVDQRLRQWVIRRRLES